MITVEQANKKLLVNQKAWNLKDEDVNLIQNCLNNKLILNKDTAQRGIYGNLIEWVESRLAQGKFLKEDQVNKLWGDSTTRALRLYQNAFGLVADGVMGQKATIALIEDGIVNKPASEFKLTLKDVQKLYIEHNYKTRDDVNICGFEGYIRDTKVPNVPDEWNDTIVIWIPSGKLYSFEGSVNPGRYYVQNPLNAEGCANLCAGQETAWAKGIHNNNHEALIQTVSKVSVWRDYNKNFKFDKSTEKIFRDWFGINIHWGYNGYYVSNASAGCQVIHMWDSFQMFMSVVTSLCKTGQYSYTLFTQEQY